MALDLPDVDVCVRCGLCLQSCPTYQLSGMEGYSPRGRIASVKAAAGAGFTPVASEYLDTCLGCRACEAVCPSGVRYGHILEQARAAAPRPGGPLRRFVETVLLWLVARQARLALASVPLWALQRAGLARALPGAAGIPRIRLRDLFTRLSSNYEPADGVDRRGQVVLFTGCVQDVWTRDVHWATIAVLTRLGYTVRVPHGQRCCGALHAHAGRSRWAQRLASRNAEPLGRFDGAIVVNAAGCGAKLKEYDDPAVAGRVVDITEILDPELIRRLDPAPPEGLERVAVHDPCHLAHAQGITRQPRDVLRAAGYEVRELGDGARCCGAAGTYSVYHREWAAPLLEAKIAACASAGGDAVAVANPGCLFWMGSTRGTPPMYHPVQLVALALARTT